ncbi:MAG: hypothetical protein MUF16_29020 [Burkholderiaceae bacterium]|jgi:hypothetical protein|nr:hypothetical protein [Burkholderiaceae bacterium]
MSNIKLIATRPMMLHAKRVEAGDIFSVDAAAAIGMCESGRCQLLDPVDRQVIHEAGRAELRRQLRQAPAPQPPPGPWLPVN